MKKIVKIGIAIAPLFIIGHLTQSWPFVYGGLVEFAIIAALFYKESRQG